MGTLQLGLILDSRWLKKRDEERREIARQITWDRDSTPEEVKIYKKVKRMIVARYGHDAIFQQAARHLTAPDRHFISELLKQHPDVID